MIDQLSTLGKVNSIGRDGFLWWIGQVAPPQSWRNVNAAIREDGSKATRVKVRIVGYHPFDPEGTILPDEDLPWADVLPNPFSGSGQGGLSENLTLVGGERVLGFFLDGEDAQQPVVISLFPKYNKVEDTFDQNEILNKPSSGGNSFPAYTRNDSSQPPSPGNHQFGSVNLGLSDKKIIGITAGQNNKADIFLEQQASKEASGWTACNDTTVGKVSQAVTDFIQMLQGLENAGDSWIDPLTNTIIDMQAELAFIKNEVAGVVRASLNEMKVGLMKQVNKKFKKLIGDIKKNDPDGLFKEKAAEKSKGTITDLLNCAFNAALLKAGEFILNMFKNLLGKAFNAAICAIEQFTAGIFSKLFDTLESALGTIMSGLNWLVGGFDSIKNTLRSVSGLASKILGYIKGCNIEVCAKPTTFASNLGARLSAPDDYEGLLKKANVLSGISKGVTEAGRGGIIKRGINGAIERIFAPSEVKAYADDKGISLSEAKNILSGGTNETVIDGDGIGDTTLYNDDQAMSGLTIFGDGDFLFEDCNRTNDNPPSQLDIIPRRPGFIYPKCLPPDYQVIGSGTGAELLIIVGNSRRIFSVEVINGGSGYDTDTQITIIDNTGNGTGANVKPIIKDGSIVSVVILSAGFGYCLGGSGGSDVGISTNITGEITDIYVSKPGIGYDPKDTVTFEGVDDGVNIPIVTTPSGSIAAVNFPPSIPKEFEIPPVLIVNSVNGIGVELIPIMKTKPQTKTDVGAESRKRLIGIESVIDCIGDKNELIGYVNGVEYYGPFHVHQRSDGSIVKMVGSQHVDYPHEIIYATIEESLGGSPIVSQTSSSITSDSTEVPEIETPVDSEPTIVTEQTSSTSSTSMVDTTTDTSTSSGTSDPTPPSSPPSSPPSGGGYGGGY